MNDPVRMSERSEEPLRVTVEQATPAAVVVRLTGDLDLLTTPALHDRLWPVLEVPDRTVLIDLSEVGFLGSAGLAELAAANETAGRHGIRIVLVAAARAVLRPLEVTGMLTLFPVFDSVESALLDL